VHQELPGNVRRADVTMSFSLSAERPGPRRSSPVPGFGGLSGRTPSRLPDRGQSSSIGGIQGEAKRQLPPLQEVVATSPLDLPNPIRLVEGGRSAHDCRRVRSRMLLKCHPCLSESVQTTWRATRKKTPDGRLPDRAKGAAREMAFRLGQAGEDNDGKPGEGGQDRDS
jgi:hypothetical protein